MSLPDYDVLTALSVAGGGRMQITVLAAQIGWERSRVSHHVRRMTARGLVTCGLSAADRRVTEVTLTAQGRQALEEAAPGHVDLVRHLFFGGLPAAWWGRSARHWKACTPTSSDRARSRRRSTGTRRRTDQALPLPAPSRAGRQPRLPCPGQAHASRTPAAQPLRRDRPGCRRGSRGSTVPAKPREAPAPARGCPRQRANEPGALGGTCPAGPGPGSPGSRLGRPGTPAGLPVANYVMCHIRLRDMSRTLTRSASDRPAGAGTRDNRHRGRRRRRKARSMEQETARNEHADVTVRGHTEAATGKELLCPATRKELPCPTRL